MRKAIIIGASSGIGLELARVMSADGWELGLTARRRGLLEELRDELPNPARIGVFDVSEVDEGMAALADLLEDMDPVDCVVVNAGIGKYNTRLEWDRERQTIDLNVRGFAAMANVAYQYFTKKGGGHIVGISSVARHRGEWRMPAYSASKAFVSNYMEGLRLQALKKKRNITVTDIRPGFVQTPLLEGARGLFWVEKVEVAARDIYKAMKKRKKRAYITCRWGLVGLALSHLPDSLYAKL